MLASIQILIGPMDLSHLTASRHKNTHNKTTKKPMQILYVQLIFPYYSYVENIWRDSFGYRQKANRGYAVNSLTTMDADLRPFF